MAIWRLDDACAATRDGRYLFGHVETSVLGRWVGDAVAQSVPANVIHRRSGHYLVVGSLFMLFDTMK